MRKYFPILLFIAFGFNLSAQTIFDIQVDGIFLENEEIRFQNDGEIHTYECSLDLFKQKDFSHLLALDCWSSKGRAKSEDKIPFGHILKFQEPDSLRSWLSRRIFGHEANAEEEFERSFLKVFDNHLIAQYYLQNNDQDTPDWIFAGADFVDYVFLRINQEYLIIALVSVLDDSVYGYIVPTIQGGVAVWESEKYLSDQIGLADTLSPLLTNEIPLRSFYRVRKEGNKQVLYDKLFHENVFDEGCREIRLGTNYLICETEEEVRIYDKTLKNIVADDLLAAYDSIQSVQVLKNNQIQWIDYQGNVHDTFPQPKYALCGTIRYTNRAILKRQGAYWIKTSFAYPGVAPESDSVLVSISDTIQSITYLNGKTSHDYDEYSSLNQVFSFPYNLYLIESAERTNLVTITNRKDSLKRALIIERDYRTRDQATKDSLDIQIARLKDDLTIKEHFAGELEGFGYYHPIKFKEKNLYGYYPQNKEARYKRIKKFILFFAKFELPNGLKGWLDIYGNEYFER